MTMALATTAPAEVAGKVARLREWLDERGRPGVVLTGQGPVAWLTAGMTDPIERGAPTGLVWVLVTPETATLITTNVELPRLRAEEPLAALGLDAVEVPWHDGDAPRKAAEEIAGAPATELAADGHPAFADADDDLTALRMRMEPPEQDRLLALGAAAARALEGALRGWTPGERDRDVSARLVASLEREGILPACLLLGGDDRVERYRHPVATGEPMLRHAMAVLVGERGGLHVALTRFATADSRASRELADACRRAALVEVAMLKACRPGATYGDVLQASLGGYADAGHPDGWREHYQGGPIGYRQREWEIAPTDTGSRWYAQRVEAGHAIAFNPSVPGGGKVEDTFVVTADGLRSITDSGRWPMAPPAPGLPARPQILDLSEGDNMPDQRMERRT
jgi:Xaa-Pro aminopeptidase